MQNFGETIFSNRQLGMRVYIRIIIVNFKQFGVKSMMFQQQNVHKYTWTSPDWKAHNQITY